MLLFIQKLLLLIKKSYQQQNIENTIIKYIEKIYNISYLRIEQKYKKLFKYYKMNIINLSIILS